MGKVVDTDTEFGARVDRRLHTERIAWLVTVGGGQAPYPNPVWFYWDGGSILVYSQPGQAKLRHIEQNPNVAVHLDSQSSGDDVVIVNGTASIDDSAPRADQIPEYVDKYRDEMRRLNLGTPAEMAAAYTVAIRITPTKVRGY